MKHIVIMGTLDTKEEQILFAKDRIENLGYKTIIMDTSTRAHSSMAADITCDETARAAGTTIETIRSMGDRPEITSLMTKGAINNAHDLLAKGKLDGLMALGGAGAATVGTAVMRALPFGIPKLMVCAAACMPYAGSWFGTGDIMMMNTIVDIAGLNKLVKNILSRAAGAICGMVEQAHDSIDTLLKRGQKPMIAMTEDGASEKCAAHVRRALMDKGYEVVIFHAQGIGDRAMEDFIEQGFFDGVVDIALMGVSDELFEGNRPGGAKRLEMAGKRGIPLAMAPCGMNQTGCGPTRKNREKYASRDKILKLDELRMGTRLNEEELILTARTVAAKLNNATGPVKFFIPLNGWSSFDSPGGPLYSPKEDMIFINEIKQLLKPEIELIEINANLEDTAFAQAMVDGFDHMMRAWESGKT
jgi:uncharacterized protein (UPF0261 family)